MKTRTSKAIGVVVGAGAIALSVPLAVSAYAEPTTHTRWPRSPIPRVRPATPSRPPCRTSRRLANVARQQRAGRASPTPALSAQAISGQLNPAVNVASVFDNGPYVVFAPTNEAFAALPPEQLDALRADPAALTRWSTTTPSSACWAPTTSRASARPRKAPRSR